MSEDPNEKYLIYLGYWDENDEVTKIGKTTNMYNRCCNYNTSHPFLDFTPYVIIEVYNEDDLDNAEEYLHYVYKEYSASHSPEYKKRNKCNEWFTTHPSQAEVEEHFQKLGIDYRAFSDDELEKEMRLIHEKEREYNEKKQEKRNKIRKRIKEQENKRNGVICKYPKSFQEPIINNIHQYFLEYDVGHIIEPCGLGKSFIAIYYALIGRYKSILFGVPSGHLLSQMRKEIIEILPDAIVMFVGGQNNQKIKTIETEMKKARDAKKPFFVISTYASCYKLKGIAFEFKIGDECHHLTGIESNKKQYLIFHEIISKKTLFMTATKKIINTHSEHTAFTMEDEEVFGKCIDEKSVMWAIDNKVITDYKVVVLKAKGDKIDEIIDELDIQLTEKNTELFVSAYMTLKSIEMYDDLTHVLCYTNTTQNANQVEQFIDILLDKGIFSSLSKEQFYNKALHSENSSTNRLKIEVDNMKKKKYGIISCVFIFGEGFDLPKLNGVCFAENMVSIIRIIQCALRASRIEKGNILKMAHMLIPTVDHDDFYEDSTSHKKIRTIVGNLANVDENISERLIVNTLTKRKDKRGQKTPGRGDDVFDFENSDFELTKLRLRLRMSKDLKSKLSMEQEEYNFHKALLKEHNVKSKREYDDFVHEDKKDDIEGYFKQNGVWPDSGWYDLLSIDTSMYPTSKDEWKRICKEKNIKSMEEYKTYCEQPDSDLPSEPDKLYHKEWMSSIEVELGISRPRRR